METLLVMKLLKSAGKFIVDNWKPILCVVLLLGYTYAVYQWGYGRADGVWVKQHNKDVAALNNQIADIEQRSKAEADRLKAQATLLQQQLDDIVQKSPNMYAYNGEGSLIMCNDKPMAVYLGPQFVHTWNLLNLKGNAR